MKPLNRNGAQSINQTKDDKATHEIEKFVLRGGHFLFGNPQADAKKANEPHSPDDLCDPICSPINPAFYAQKCCCPFHSSFSAALKRRACPNLDVQSRSSSLMLVLERVCASTVLTMTAQ